MKKYRNFVIFLILMFNLILTSQTYATEIEVNDNSPIIKVNEDLTLKDSIKRSKYNRILKATEIENIYNLNDSQSIRVKNQKTSSCCWGFSFSTLLETSIAKQSGKQSKEYSPMHMEYSTLKLFNRTLGSGAGPSIATAYCVNGMGPVEEAKLPFNNVYDDINHTYKNIESIGDINKNIDARIKDTVIFPHVYKGVNGGNINYFSKEDRTQSYTLTEVNAIRKLIKEHIKNYGAISADFYMDMSNKYYNSSTGAYNYNEYENKSTMNHVVTIVGWDDNYQTSNFSNSSVPKDKGAYIVLNSYGNDFGKNGYMYVSYEDVCIEENLMGLTSVEEYKNEKKDYDKLYQYDELGMNAGVTLGGTSLYAANKYTRENINNKDEYLNEVGLYISETSGIEVYINAEDENIENCKLVSTLSALEPGYHVIKLSTPIKLTGNKFVIKVKYINQEQASIPMEINYKSSNLEDTSAFYNNATANDDECFISKDNITWSDVNKLTIKFSDGQNLNLKDASNCIKAFTIYQEKTIEDVAVKEIKLNKEHITLNVGDSETLIATIYPENVTNKKVRWNSSNEKIATITETGIITAKSEGTTTISAVTENGNKIATCKVTVITKTNSDDDIYKENNELNSNEAQKDIINTTNNDKTIAKTILPYAGTKIIKIIILLMSLGIMGVMFLKYTNLRNIK